MNKTHQEELIPLDLGADKGARPLHCTGQCTEAGLIGDGNAFFVDRSTPLLFMVFYCILFGMS